uniref:Uncharacterized protein n=1 Tax=Heterorhabditis bacteriophora TaxID=37862 RepID=A0A1I7WSA2_HETBA
MGSSTVRSYWFSSGCFPLHHTLLNTIVFVPFLGVSYKCYKKHRFYCGLVMA